MLNSKKDNNHVISQVIQAQQYWATQAEGALAIVQAGGTYIFSVLTPT